MFYIHMFWACFWIYDVQWMNESLPKLWIHWFVEMTASIESILGSTVGATCYIYHGRLWWLFLISVPVRYVTVFDVEGSFSGLSTSIISTHSSSASAILRFPFWRDNTPIILLGITGHGWNHPCFQPSHTWISSINHGWEVGHGKRG